MVIVPSKPQSAPYPGSPMRIPLRTSILLFLTFSWTTTEATAQAKSWQLPEQGAAVFERKRQEAIREVERAHGQPDHASKPGFTISLNPPVLFAGELDQEQQHIAGPVYDIRDVPMTLAFDLRRSRGLGKQTYAVPSSTSTCAMSITAKYGRVDANGIQPITARITALPVPRDVESLPKFRYTMSGVIKLKRHFDRVAGRVAWFESTMKLDVTFHRSRVARRALWTTEERWQWAGNREENAAFRTRVANAINKGRQELRQELAELADKNFVSQRDDSGYLALMMLTLLKTGEVRTDPLIKMGLDELRRREIHETYDLALALMAMEAAYAPQGERDDLIRGAIPSPRRRTPTVQDLVVMSHWTDRLLGNIDSTVDPAYVRRWHYRPSNHYDNSNTQYALLGLYSAQLCGVEISRGVWHAALRHLLADAQQIGKQRRKVQLESHARATSKQKKKRTSSTAQAVPIAWGYRADEEPTGSMTAAGISGLTICEAGLAERGGKLTAAEREHIRKARLGGFSWFARNLTVRANPTGNTHWTTRRYYYLFGLERACELSMVARLHGRNWYFEGAELIMQHQYRGGSWGELSRTCFALLFLKKAVVGPITPLRQTVSQK